MYMHSTTLTSPIHHQLLPQQLLTMMMAPTHSQSQLPSKLFASDIAKYSDTELDQYLQANGRIVQVEDPEKLSEEFIQRLRARTGPTEAATNRPIDLNYVSARLEEISADKKTSPQLCSLATTPDIDDEEDYLYLLKEETWCYNTLVNEGGRPSHPISLGRDILENPGEEYREIFSYWKTDDYDWRVFADQLREWQKFRQYQREVRQANRFPAYWQRLQDRLARHEFTRSFQLEEELNRQNPLATWVEFLNYKYQDYEKATKYVERHHEQHDKAWKKLVDSKTLRPLETEELVWDYFFAVRLQNENDEAEKNMNFALSTVNLTEKSLEEAQRVHADNSSHLKQKLSTAKTRLAATTESYESINTRYESIYSYWMERKHYRSVQDKVSRLGILLRWMLQQVPLIELESNPAKVNEKNPTREEARCESSLKRKRADDRSEELASKRQKQDGESHTLQESTIYASTTREDAKHPARGKDRCESRLKRKRADDHSEVPVSKRQKQDGKSHTSPESKVHASTTRETSSTGRPRQTRISHAKSETLGMETRSLRSLRASRALNIKLDRERSGVVLDNGARAKKRGRPRKLSLGGTSDSRVLRRSSRRKRPPERFQ